MRGLAVVLACAAGCIEARRYDAAELVDAAPLVDPAGTNHTYVISALDIPSSRAEATALGLDIDGKQGDGVDNQLGTNLGTLENLAPDLDLQAAIDVRIAAGDIITLVNIQATALDDATGVSLALFPGRSPQPVPCRDVFDTVCGRHLTGGATFQVAVDATPDPAVPGFIVGGKLTAGPGTLKVRLSFTGGPPFDLQLRSARVELEAVGPSGWASGKLGGAVDQRELDDQLIPAIGRSVRLTFDQGCRTSTQGGLPPGCGCTADTTADDMRVLFDVTPRDCEVTDAEVDTVVADLLAKDLDTDGDGVDDAVSFGVGISAVAAGFAPPGP